MNLGDISLPSRFQSLGQHSTALVAHKTVTGDTQTNMFCSNSFFFFLYSPSFNTLDIV